jgi:hypothetical protein
MLFCLLYVKLGKVLTVAGDRLKIATSDHGGKSKPI